MGMVFCLLCLERWFNQKVCGFELVVGLVVVLWPLLEMVFDLNFKPATL
jgi:hypothetical protein